MTADQERLNGLPQAYDFKIQPRAEFEATAPTSLVQRDKKLNGAFVLWDPLDDEEGFLACADTIRDLNHAWHEQFPEL